MRFLGTIDSKTDAKGRVFLPASFRKVLSTAGAERLVLRKDIFQPCLVLYPESVWNQMLDSLRAIVGFHHNTNGRIPWPSLANARSLLGSAVRPRALLLRLFACTSR